MAARSVTGANKPLKFEADLNNNKLLKKIKDSIVAFRELHKAGNVSGGNGSGITPVLATESKLRDKIIQQLEKQRIRQEELNKTIQRRPAFTAQDTAAELAAAQRGKTGTISGGTLVNSEQVKAAAVANSALASSTNNVTAAEIKRTVATNAQTAAQRAQMTSLDSLKIKLESYKAIAASSTDPARLTTYNRKIQETEVEIARMSNVGKEGFNKLGDAVKGSTNYVGKAWGAIRQLAYVLPGIGIAGILAFAIDPIVNYLQQLDLFKKKVDEAKRAKQELDDVGLTGTKNAQSELTTLRLLYNQYQNNNTPLRERKSAYEQMQKLYPAYFGNLAFEERASRKTATAYDTLTTSILATARARAAADKIAENASRQLDNEQRIRELEAEKIKIQNQTAKTVKSSGQFDPYSGSGTAAIAATLDLSRKIGEVQVKINGYKKDSAILTERSLSLEKEVNKEVKKGGKLTGGFGDVVPTKDLSKQIKAAEDLQRQVDDILQKYKRKSLSPDQEAAQSINDEFKRIADKVKQFNADPKHKIKIQTDNLEELRKLAVSDLQYDLATAKIQQSLDEQRDLYRAFEDDKEKIGIKAATERYEGELDVSKTFLQKLQDEQAKLYEQSSGQDFSAAQQARLKWINEQIGKELKLNKDKNDKLLVDLMNYEAQRKLITETYYAKRAELISQGKIDEVTVLEQNYKEDINNLDDANFQKLESYKAFFAGVEDLSTKSAKVVITRLREALAKAVKDNKISPEFAKEIADSLDKATESVQAKFPKSLGEAASQLSDIAGLVSEIDGGFGAMFRTLSTVVGNIGTIKTIMDSIAKAQKNGGVGLLGGITSGLGIAGAFLGAVRSVVSFVDSIGEKRRQKEAADLKYSQDLQMKQIDAISKALERQLELINDIYGTDRIKAYGDALQDIRTEQDKSNKELEGRVALTGMDKGFDADLTRRNNGQKTWSPVFRGLYEAFQQAGQIVELKGKKTEELQKLLDSGLLDDQTAAVVRNLVTLEDQYRKTVNAMNAELTGTSFSGITDEITQLFANATTSAEDFGKSFQEIMKKSLLNSFKRNALETELQKFYDQFAEASKSGGSLDKKEIGELEELYNSIIENAQTKFDDLEKIAGVSFAKTPDKAVEDKSPLAGAFARASQESVDLLAGQFGGMRLAQLEGNQIMRTNAASQLNMMNLQLNNLIAIERNTGVTAGNSEHLKRLEKVENLLVNIDRTFTANKGMAKAAGF